MFCPGDKSHISKEPIFCITCNIKIDKNNYSKDRTVCKSCYNKKRRKNNNNTTIGKEIGISPQQPKIHNINKKNTNNIVSAYEDHRHLIIGPSNVGKTYYMLKVLEKLGNKRPINITTRTPNQYPNYKTSYEIKPTDKYKGSVGIFDDMLGAKNSSQVDDFFSGGRHEILDVYYISQSFFGLPRQSIRNNSDRLILLKQTLRDVQSMYQDIGAFDMKYHEDKETCRVAWSEKFKYLCIDLTKNKNEAIYKKISKKAKTHILNVFRKMNFFKISIP